MNRGMHKEFFLKMNKEIETVILSLRFVEMIYIRIPGSFFACKTNLHLCPIIFFKILVSNFSTPKNECF